MINLYVIQCFRTNFLVPIQGKKKPKNRELTEYPCETGRIDVTGSEIRFRATVDRLTRENPENSVALGGNRK